MHSDGDAIWALRVLRGEILNSAGTCRQAIAFLSSLRIPLRLAKTRVAADRLSALGLAQSHCSDFPAARRSFDAAQSIAHAVDAESEARVLVRKADFEIATRAWSAAERDSRTLIATASSPRYASRGWAALGKLRGQQERYDEAIEANERALGIASSNNDASLATIVRLNLGWLYVVSGDYDRAIEMLSAVEAETARLGRKNDRIVALMQLGNAHLNQSRPEEARRYYEQAIVIAKEMDSPQRAYLLENLARVELAAGAFSRANTLNAEAIVLHEQRREAEDGMRALALSGRIREGMGDPAGAETIYRRVVHESASRLAAFEAGYFLASLHANNGRRALAGEEFKRAILQSEGMRKLLKSEELKLSFTTTLQAVVNDYIEFLIVEGQATAALRVAESSRARTLSEAFGQTKAAAPPVDYRRIARARGPILSYWLTPRVSFLWVVDPKAISVFRLPPQAEIASAVEAYQRDLSGPRGNLESIAAGGQALWTMLQPGGVVESKRIVVVPDKELHALNFETLVPPSTSPHFWIEDATITTASSIELLARSVGRRKSARSLLLVGDPQASDGLPPLEWAKEEMQRVREHFEDAKVIDGAGATPAAYTAAASPRYGYVHFVAHGIGNATRPLDSAIVLGGKLYAREILRHRLEAALVTVSSCHGAGQRAYAGEGLVGLAWAFLRAGAHEVIAALWEVSDSATPQLMDAMYAGIARGEEPADALRAAKLSLLRSNTIYRRPLYWAPFVLYAGS